MIFDKKQLSYILLLVSLLNASCSSTSVAPVSTRNAEREKQSKPVTRSKQISSSATINKNRTHHIVTRGDTLYSISWNYNLDYKQVARWNNIRPPYVIFPGQSIRLLEPHVQKRIVRNTASDEPARTEKKSVIVNKTTKPAEPTAFAKNVIWQWPTTGKLVDLNSPISKKGLNIAGKNGQVIKASAAGSVVYSGSGLLGYGKLIIIKHNETYLSAYAHNSVLMVKEGDSVSGGQQIAKMGQDGNGQVLLHFEIRKNGNPIDPANYLPKHQS